MPHFSILLYCLQNIYTKALDYLFPKDSLLQKIESMNISGWRERIQPEHHTNNNIHTVSLFVFSDSLAQRLIHALKYERNNHAYTVCATQLAKYITTHVLNTSYVQYALSPVPQSKQRRRERGYNQCELLTKNISKQLPKLEHLPYLLTKTRHTKSQTTKNKQERLQNLQNSIDCNKKYVAHLTAESVIIVIDDVYTTGATQTEVVRALQTVPYAALYFLTIARA